jgi:hypothetical protein
MGMLEQMQQQLSDQAAAIRQLEREVAYLKKGLSAWVGTEEAERITGLKRKALDVRRSYTGIWELGADWKKEGSKVLYNRTSLEAYNDSHTPRRKRKIQ